jgi:hypothetical protein
LANRPEILQNCYKIFAALFEPALVANVDSIREILQEVALQDSRAANIIPASIVET